MNTVRDVKVIDFVSVYGLIVLWCGDYSISNLQYCV